MSNAITASKFVDEIKVVGVRFPISGTVKTKDGLEFFGSGSITRTEDEFILNITFPLGDEPPQVNNGVYSIEDFWSFDGIIGTNLRFIVEHLSPFGTTHTNNGITSKEFETQALLLPPEGFDAMPIRQLGALLDAMQEAANENGGRIPPGLSVEIPASPPMELRSENEKPTPYSKGVWIHALVPEYPLIHTNGGTEFIERNDFLGEMHRSTADTFTGSFEGVKFGLVIQ